MYYEGETNINESLGPTGAMMKLEGPSSRDIQRRYQVRKFSRLALFIYPGSVVTIPEQEVRVSVAQPFTKIFRSESVKTALILRPLTNESRKGHSQVILCFHGTSNSWRV